MHTPNRLGIECEYSEEIQKDMKAIYNIDIKELFMNSYGTSFNIEKTMQDGGLRFVLTTNDSRDESIVWFHDINEKT